MATAGLLPWMLRLTWIAVAAVGCRVSSAISGRSDRSKRRHRRRHTSDGWPAWCDGDPRHGVVDRDPRDRPAAPVTRVALLVGGGDTAECVEFRRGALATLIAMSATRQLFVQASRTATKNATCCTTLGSPPPPCSCWSGPAWCCQARSCSHRERGSSARLVPRRDRCDRDVAPPLASAVARLARDVPIGLALPTRSWWRDVHAASSEIAGLRLAPVDTTPPPHRARGRACHRGRHDGRETASWRRLADSREVARSTSRRSSSAQASGRALRAAATAASPSADARVTWRRVATRHLAASPPP